MTKHPFDGLAPSTEHRTLTRATHEFAKLIAVALGSGWSYDQERSFDKSGELWHSAYIIDEHRRWLSLWLQASRKELRLQIATSARYDELQRANASTDGLPSASMTLAVTTSAEKAARAIERKLFPTLNALRDEMAARLANATERSSRIAAIRQQLEATGGVVVTRSRDHEHIGVNIGHQEGYGTVAIYSDGSVRIEATVPADMAVAMLAALAEVAKGRRA